MTREVWRPANTMLVSAWVGRVSAVSAESIEHDLTFRVSRLPGLRYMARMHRIVDGPLHCWIITVQKAREFAPSEAESLAALFKGATIPAGWQIATESGRPARVNPPAQRIVRVRVSKQHAPDPVAWARDQRGIGEPWTFTSDGEFWDLRVTDPFETLPEGWKAVSRTKGIFVQFGRVRDSATGVWPKAENPCHRLANPVHTDAGDLEKESIRLIRESGKAYDALASKSAELDKLWRVFYAAPVNAETEGARRKFEEGAREHSELALAHQKAVEASIAVLRRLAAARRRENPAPDPARFAEGIDSFVKFHWGRAPNEVRNVPRAEVVPASPLVGLGELVEVVYRTRKGKDRLAHDWRHGFGVDERTGSDVGSRPVLAVDSRGRLCLVGGSYSVESRGIVG